MGGSVLGGDVDGFSFSSSFEVNGNELIDFAFSDETSSYKKKLIVDN
jgi:hypothetical protein